MCVWYILLPFHNSCYGITCIYFLHFLPLLLSIPECMEYINTLVVGLAGDGGGHNDDARDESAHSDRMWMNACYVVLWQWERVFFFLGSKQCTAQFYMATMWRHDTHTRIECIYRVCAHLATSIRCIVFPLRLFITIAYSAQCTRPATTHNHVFDARWVRALALPAHSLSLLQWILSSRGLATSLARLQASSWLHHSRKTIFHTFSRHDTLTTPSPSNAKA